MPHTLLDQMACEAGRAAARVFTMHTQRRVPLYGLMQLTRVCGDAFSGIDTRRAQLGDQLELLTTLDGDVPPDGYAKLDLECQRRQGQINALVKALRASEERVMCDHCNSDVGVCEKHYDDLQSIEGLLEFHKELR